MGFCLRLRVISGFILERIGLFGFTGGPYSPVFIKRFLNITKQKWEPNIQHKSKADNLWACFKVAEWKAFYHFRRYKYTLPTSTEFNLKAPVTLLISNIFRIPNLNMIIKILINSASLVSLNCKIYRGTPYEVCCSSKTISDGDGY